MLIICSRGGSVPVQDVRGEAGLLQGALDEAGPVDGLQDALAQRQLGEHHRHRRHHDYVLDAGRQRRQPNNSSKQRKALPPATEACILIWVAEGCDTAHGTRAGSLTGAWP